VCNQKGDLEGFEIIVENVHERRLLEEQFRQTQRMEAVARLAAGVAQDFNALLAGIIESSNKLLEPLRLDHPMFEGVRAIKEAGEKASELTSQLLTLGRRQAFAPVELNLNSLLVGMEMRLRQLTGENIEVLLAPDIYPNHVLVDPTQIEQAVLNLVINAHDSMPQGGTIMLETLGVDIDADSARSNVGLRPGPYALLTVTDNGNGTDPEILSHIFEPFITPGGKGMQLAMVYGLVKQNGGEIEVYSDLGLGTTFVIYLPRIRKQAQPESGLSGEYEARGQTILLIEEAKYLRALARRILGMEGYHVLEASRLDEAVALCKRHEGVIGLMITDVVMPEMMGREMAARIARVQPGIRVLFTTGFADDAMRSRGTLASGNVFIAKPFTPGALIQKVREVLGTSDRAEPSRK
jgi:nitrogen-specific signal transduction histidine kinase/ActR/RegA family two-component response regulator